MESRLPSTSACHRTIGSVLATPLLLFLLCTPSFGEADDAEVLAEKHRAEAEAKFAQQDFEGAAEAYRAAIEPLAAALAAEEEEQVDTISSMRTRLGATSQALADDVEEVLARHDAIGRLLGRCELGLARCLARLDRPEEACRALGRALGYDLELREEHAAGGHFESLMRHPDYAELEFRLTLGRGHLDSGDPIEYAYRDRDHRWRLRLPPGDAALAAKEGVIGELARIVSVRAGIPTPDTLPFDTYVRLVRLSLVRIRTHGGWPYRHEKLFEPNKELRVLQKACEERFQERREERDGPFWAFVSFFPTLHLGKLDVVGRRLDYLREHSPFFHDRALDGLRWVLRVYLEEGSALPDTSLGACRAMQARARKEYEASDFPVTRLQAWMGWPAAMNRYGEFYVLGMHGLPKSYDKAFPWFHGADALDYERARLHVAQAYMEGLGVEPDLERGIDLMTRLADGGDIMAIASLAYYYQYGVGVERDYERARKLFRKAAEAKNPNAMESLGLLLQRGLGGERDFDEALRWYRKAHAADHPRALRRIGNLTFDTRRDASQLSQTCEYLERALKETPGDQLAMLYLWAALELRHLPDEAKGVVETYLSNGEPVGFDRELASAMTSKRFNGSRLLRKARKIEDEEDRDTAIGRTHFVAGVKALAAEKASRARKSFEACIEEGHEADSTRFSAMTELERLE